jgi:hypothetical protein
MTIGIPFDVHLHNRLQNGGHGHPHPASDWALSIQHSLGGGYITPAEHVALVCWPITTHGQDGVYKKKKQELDPRRKKSVIMAWQAGVAPFEGGAINVWSLRLSKPRVDGVFYVMLSEVCHEPSMAQKGNRRGLRNCYGLFPSPLQHSSLEKRVDNSRFNL